ncbi:hypothetical protein L195_g023926 [Trifolium pratense]|uniref:Uncharacterized protein n=1 Tax=Trifolium pratense TaxID=57577 RepID=A0A2K3NC74_TRIPR|nr:hypothetical protein L195_g023926 [Trifolium pratense]
MKVVMNKKKMKNSCAGSGPVSAPSEAVFYFFCSRDSLSVVYFFFLLVAAPDLSWGGGGGCDRSESKVMWGYGGEVLMWRCWVWHRRYVIDTISLYLVDLFRFGVDCLEADCEPVTYLPKLMVLFGGLEAEECLSKNEIRGEPLLGGVCFLLFTGVPLIYDAFVL